MALAIGIDLGTTYTVAATLNNGRPAIIPNSEGQRLTPSVVGFTPEGKVLVGESAIDMSAVYPERVMFSVKRCIGSGRGVTVAEKEHTPEEISGLILHKVKEDIETHLRESVDRAVITVPAYFNDRQRQATREAGRLAGLDVMRIINEPTAAALAYGLDREDVQTILIWDIGGGTFDVSILELGDGIFEVRAVSGDTQLGGDDFDQRVIDYLIAEYRHITGADFPRDGLSKRKLKLLAEEAKIRLSSLPLTRVRLTSPDDISVSKGPLEVELSRERLEAITADLLERMAAATQQSLDDAGLSPEEIDRVVLVGGATRMPSVRNLVRRVLHKEPYCYIDPDTVVASGAAIQAGMLLGLVDKAVLLDVLPLSLGVETQGGLMSRIIHRNTPLPASESRIFTTATNLQTSMDIRVLQGERALAEDNVSLGQFQLTGIPASSRGTPKVEVAFEADVDGIVRISARDLLSENEISVGVVSTKPLDSDCIEKMADEAMQSTAEDDARRKKIEARIEARNVIDAAEMALTQVTRKKPRCPVRQVQLALSNLRDALVDDNLESLKACSSDLRQLLAALGKARIGSRPG